jgi:hypothetical protein
MKWRLPKRTRTDHPENQTTVIKKANQVTKTFMRLPRTDSPQHPLIVVTQKGAMVIDAASPTVAQDD